jgi:hypothetical protein
MKISQRFLSILAIAFISLAATGAFAKSTTTPLSGHKSHVASTSNTKLNSTARVKHQAAKKQPNTRKIVTMTKSNGKIYTHQKL